MRNLKGEQRRRRVSGWWAKVEPPWLDQDQDQDHGPKPPPELPCIVYLQGNTAMLGIEDEKPIFKLGNTVFKPGTRV